MTDDGNSALIVTNFAWQTKYTSQLIRGAFKLDYQSKHMLIKDLKFLHIMAYFIQRNAKKEHLTRNFPGSSHFRITKEMMAGET
jgi:hypothetical protein